jgi:hypothetical protein
VCGEWIRASPTTYSTFQGLLFTQQPNYNFGWIIDATNPRREPSFNAATVKESLTRNTVVKVYDEKDAEGTKWYMIGIGKWVERRAIRVIYPHTDAPSGVDDGRWIEVNLYEQTLSVYENNQLIFATLAATGAQPYYTKPGLFHIREKKDFETMTGAFASVKRIITCCKMSLGRCTTMDHARCMVLIGVRCSVTSNRTAASTFPSAIPPGCTNGRTWVTRFTSGIPAERLPPMKPLMRPMPPSKRYLF